MLETLLKTIDLNNQGNINILPFDVTSKELRKSNSVAPIPYHAVSRPKQDGDRRDCSKKGFTVVYHYLSFSHSLKVGRLKKCKLKNGQSSSPFLIFFWSGFKSKMRRRVIGQRKWALPNLVCVPCV